MSSLRQALEDYLRLRRSLGYKLTQQGKLLSDFVAYVERLGSPFLTTAAALDFATQPVNAIRSTWAGRLSVVRHFAQYVRALDSRTEVPPPKLLPFRKRRLTPYLYSEADVRALMRAAQALRAPAFSRLMSTTLIGTLATTGMRVGEAIGLDRSDFDKREGILSIREGKFGKSREVPLHPSTREALRAYEKERNRTLPRPRSSAFFLSRVGTRLHRQNVSMTFSRVRRHAGLEDRKPRRPRIHDLRHTFAVQTLLAWYRAGADVEAQLPRLSTYLGHVNPSTTYWYLTATPELVALAARRLDHDLGEPR